MIKTRVGLLFGGKSDEHTVSIMSAVSIFKHLDKTRFDVVPFGISKEGSWICLKNVYEKLGDELIDFEQLQDQIKSANEQTTQEAICYVMESIDVIFPALHGPYGEDGTVQGFCDMLDVPYVGARVASSAICMDKAFTKRILKGAGIPVTPWVEVKKAHYENNVEHVIKEIEETLKCPMFVKPANLGSSVGISKVKSISELKNALKEALKFDAKVLVEEGIACREIECAVLGNDAPEASCVGEIIPAHEFYDYEAKYFCDGDSKMLIPATIDEEVSDKIRAFALKAYKTLDISGLARVDFFVEKETGEIILNEINTMPGFTKFSMYPLLWAESGVGYSELLTRLISLAQERR